VIDRTQLINELRGSTVSEWVLVERDREIVAIDEATGFARHELRKRWTVIVHIDVPNGRGSARVELDAADHVARDVVIEAMDVARAAVNQAWLSRPPSAPARVACVDPALATGELLSALGGHLAKLVRPDGAKVTISATATRERITVDTKVGLHAAWVASEVHATALVAVDQRSLEVERDARRLVDLRLDEAVAACATDLLALATASPPIAGPCAIILSPDALLHPSNLVGNAAGLGVWSIFASFADSVVDRQGLTRYRLATPITPGADLIGQPLTIISDGALDFGMRSAPVGDEGEAVRRFPLVEGGVAVGFGLTSREAALRRRDPNGGVRNLYVHPGTWNESIPTGVRVVELRRLRDLAIDKYTGEATFEIALGIEHSAGAVRPFSGGTIRLDLVAALAKARRSSRLERRGAYVGPAAVLIDAVELVA